ncbi:MAG TPA: hypothetical protein VFI42_13005 [Thermomicrobiaceae bacterium]|nr:hypothetical protein [Thermomicrobiaceae bacterium]
MAARDREQRTLWIGVIGHRPAGLAGADLTTIAGRLRDILRQARAITGQITVVSSLAEGADRLGAYAALHAGLPLYCPLPFARDIYARDFETADSLVEYQALLDRAQRVLELPGSRDSIEEREEAYAALSAALLMLIDLLIAIWDGEEARGLGGTGNTVHAALRLGIPVVWINSQPPHEVRLLTASPDGGSISEPLDRLPARIFDKAREREVL